MGYCSVQSWLGRHALAAGWTNNRQTDTQTHRRRRPQYLLRSLSNAMKVVIMLAWLQRHPVLRLHELLTWKYWFSVCKLKDKLKDASLPSREPLCSLSATTSVLQLKPVTEKILINCCPITAILHCALTLLVEQQERHISPVDSSASTIPKSELLVVPA